MRALVLAACLTATAFAHAAQKPEAQTHSKAELVVYAYDSLLAKGGWLKAVVPEFEKSCDCRVRLVAAGDGGQLLSRLQLEAERGKPEAQVVVGVDQNLWARARALSLDWEQWRPEGWKKLTADVRAQMGEDPSGFLPFDSGVFAFMMDREGLKVPGLRAIREAPSSWRELAGKEWRRSLILEDPRTSTPGLAFVLATAALYPTESEFAAFWKALKSQWLTLAPSWDQAYGIFLKGEAPLVWSYVTSESYHRENDSKESQGRYRARVLQEGMPGQVEGAFAVRTTLADPLKRKRALAFLEFLLSEKAQARIPQTQWMMPAREGVAVPKSFEGLPRPGRLLKTETDPAKIQAILERWRVVIQ